MDQKSSLENDLKIDTKMSNRKRQKTTTTRRKGKEPVKSTPIALSSDLPIAMRLPQETLCQIFSNLVEHPVHFTRVAQVCKSWKAAADTHLYWRHLTYKMDLPPPKPRAWKYKTYKSVVEREWRNQNFCSLCFRKSNAIERLNIQTVITNSYEIAKFCISEKIDWYPIFNAENVNHEFCVFEKHFVENPNVLRNPIKLVEKDISDENIDMESTDNKNELCEKSNLFGASDLSSLSISVASSSHDLTTFSQSNTTSDLSTSVEHVNMSTTKSLDKPNSSTSKLILRHNLCRNCNTRLNSKKMEREENDRRNLLTSKLKEHGLSLRSDSRLCNSFIEHGIGDPDRIVQIMTEMNWFFKYTDYDNLRYVYNNDYLNDIDWEDGMFIDRFDMPWRRYFGRPRTISTRRVDSESGKRLALERWVQQRFSKGIFTSPSEDPTSDQRPPPTLWEQINRIIDKKSNNEEIFSEGSSSQQDRKITVQDFEDFEDFNFEDFDDEFEEIEEEESKEEIEEEIEEKEEYLIKEIEVREEYLVKEIEVREEYLVKEIEEREYLIKEIEEKEEYLIKEIEEKEEYLIKEIEEREEYLIKEIEEEKEYSLKEIEEENNPYISVTSFEYQQSKETIQTKLKLEQSKGPFNSCYEKIYDNKGLIKIDKEIFILIIKLYEFLENNIYNMLITEIMLFLPTKLKKIFYYFENFELPFIENFNWNGQYFYDIIDIKEIINQLDNGLGIRQTNYVRINSFGKIFQTDRSPLQPYSPLRPKKIYDNYENYENFYNTNMEEKTKEFLNSLNNKTEERDERNEEKDYDYKNHQEIIVDTFGNPHPINSTRKDVIISNNTYNEDETDDSIEELDENSSEFSFEELNEVSDIESVTTTDGSNTEWRLI
ncbi:hypothetical protein RhiirC2_704719 [Rhizophagus irregularis]|uniref:F-box domain-containing protein n=1 Tax=Rhizophagus irregularis TaxID=588596 RepID=A0A2N1P0Z9_9GLOM|nr:hypothetical protein RhiirC2_704719 [Rhizophagus irregularis]